MSVGRRSLLLSLLFGCLLLLAAGAASAQDEAGFTETVVTLDNGVVATPNQPVSDEPVPAVLMLHGFASYRDEVGEMYKRLAAALAERGIGSLRIDFRGWGESAGGMENSTVVGMVEDAAAGYAYLSGLDFVDSSRIGLIGFSLGGRIAIVSAGQNPDWYQSMVLWSAGGNLAPDFLGQEYVDAAAADGAVTIDLGWREVTLGAGFFDSLTAFDVEVEYPKYSGDVFIVAGTDDPDPAEYLPWYLAHAQGALRGAYLVPGGDHIYATLTDDLSMSNSVIETTAAWLAISLK